MASIKGVSIKGLKSFRGVEYPINYQGNVYYQGKKLGFWSQDDWGGPDKYDFNTNVLDKVVEEHYGKNSIYNLDCLIGEILNLIDYEKAYKKAIKNHFSAFVVITDGDEETALNVPKDTDKAVILKRCEPYIKKFEAKSRCKDQMKVMIFVTPEDFDM